MHLTTIRTSSKNPYNAPENSKTKHAPLKQLQKLQGKLMHAALRVLNGKALLSPLIALVAKEGNNKPNAYMKLDGATTQVLRDRPARLKVAMAHPTPCTDLVPADLDYGGYCNASKTDAGVFGLESTNHSFQSYGKSRSHLIFDKRLYQKQTQQDGSQIPTGKWQKCIANGCYSKSWQM